MKIAVIGAGKIGLPLATQYASRGHSVVCVDINENVVALINQGREPFPCEPGMLEFLADQVPAGQLRATSDYSAAIPGADVVVVVVPLLVDESTWEPDFTALDSATEALAPHLSKNALVCYETTLPVGTTRNRFTPLIEEISGLQEGVDFYVAFSPERVMTGSVYKDLRRYPKLIGALNAEGSRRAREFYEAVLEFDVRDDLPRANGVWDLGSAETVEMSKLAETTYRDVNIGLANQFARFAQKNEIDIYRVIEGCNSKKHSHIHTPGIAVGGHCIPVYPRLYLANDPDADIVRTARVFNATMPEYVVQQTTEIIGDLAGVKVAVLGASYRGGVKETALSGVFATVAALRERNADVSVHDPLYTAEELAVSGFASYQLGEPVEVAILQADHPEYKDLTPAQLPGIKLFVDGRNHTSPENWRGVARFVIGCG
ncbi:nucleotide sugar dehydrogenase [Canibacter sp. lx-72]|uniref:nucleotide sugar dehydrogenase n=1 Tax=Canibacter zhuwentaonis TaxID=2837491 RepID=UPI001BDD8B6C|nr:nucleotide sugar dehydrogenase [Canibacter zhuwentaonis]MBT1035422.1 nucleotide sugar dehydrogenase [Canibacter zhuwentaonis]